MFSAGHTVAMHGKLLATKLHTNMFLLCSLNRLCSDVFVDIAAVV